MHHQIIYDYLSADAIAAAVDEIAEKYKGNYPEWLSNIYQLAVQIQHEIDH